MTLISLKLFRFSIYFLLEFKPNSSHSKFAYVVLCTIFHELIMVNSYNNEQTFSNMMSTGDGRWVLRNVQSVTRNVNHSLLLNLLNCNVSASSSILCTTLSALVVIYLYLICNQDIIRLWYSM